MELSRIPEERNGGLWYHAISPNFTRWLGGQTIKRHHRKTPVDSEVVNISIYAKFNILNITIIIKLVNRSESKHLTNRLPGPISQICPFLVRISFNDFKMTGESCALFSI